MTKHMTKGLNILIIALGSIGLAGHLQADDHQQGAQKAGAQLVSPDGKRLGKVHFTQTPNGVLVKAMLQKMQPGTHAFHIHTTGECSPDFGSAGGHFNPTGAKHGFMSSDGPHLGDLPNISVPGEGQLDFDAFLVDASIQGDKNALLDDDGAAVMIHMGPDDYKTDPAGAAGNRIACGVIQAE